MAAQKKTPSNTRLKVVTHRPKKRAPTAKELRAEVERLTALLQWRQRFGVILTSGALPFVGAGLGWLGTTYLFKAIEAPT